MMLAFEFDPDKSKANRIKHGVDLGWARRLWGVRHVVFPTREVSGERRSVIVARVGALCYAAIFTKRGETVRLISCRRAGPKLETLYEAYFQD
ncbi:MAG: BrnT family toxin [Elusimicrobia bacterium]|nr:BrnT family toxin [Elusimicrobiota bacterium]